MNGGREGGKDWRSRKTRRDGGNEGRTSASFWRFVVGHSISNPNSALQRLTTTRNAAASANEVHAPLKTS